jgi:hypothetical protein
MSEANPNDGLLNRLFVGVHFIHPNLYGLSKVNYQENKDTYNCTKPNSRFVSGKW